MEKRNEKRKRVSLKMRRFLDQPLRSPTLFVSFVSPCARLVVWMGWSVGRWWIVWCTASQTVLTVQF